MEGHIRLHVFGVHMDVSSVHLQSLEMDPHGCFCW